MVPAVPRAPTSHVPDLQPCLKVWMRVPMTAATYESSPAWEVGREGDFSLGKMSGHVDLPHGRPDSHPHRWAVPCTPISAPHGLCRAVLHRVGAAGGGGDPATAAVSAPGPSPMAQALAPIGPGLLLAATGGHYMIHTAFLSRDMCSLLTFLRGRHGREHVLRKHTHCLLLLYIQTPIPGGLGS